MNIKHEQRYNIEAALTVRVCMRGSGLWFSTTKQLSVPGGAKMFVFLLAYETNNGCPSVRRAALCDIVKRCASQGLRVGIVLLNPLTQRALKNVRAYKLFKIIIQERRGFNEVRDTLGSSDIPRGYTVLR